MASLNGACTKCLPTRLNNNMNNNIFFILKFSEIDAYGHEIVCAVSDPVKYLNVDLLL